MRIHTGADVFIDYEDHNHSQLHVVFSEAPASAAHGPLSRDELRTLGKSWLMISSKHGAAYDGDPSYSDLLRFYTSRYKQISVYGFGVGALAALKFSKRIGGTTTIAVSPTGLDPQTDFDAPDNTYIIYDARDPDQKGARAYGDQRGVKTFNLSFSGKNSLQFLSDLGCLSILLQQDGDPSRLRAAVLEIGKLFDEAGQKTSTLITNKAIALRGDEQDAFLAPHKANRGEIIYSSNRAAYLEWLLAKVDPNEAEQHYIQYCALVKNKTKLNEASTELGIAIQGDVANAYWHYQQAVLFARLRRWHEAIASYQMAIKAAASQPQYAALVPDWHQELGIAYAKIYDTTNAVAQYRKWEGTHRNRSYLDKLVPSIEVRNSIHFVNDVLYELRENAKNRIKPRMPSDRLTFVYWEQGLNEETLPIVKQCIASLERSTQTRNFVFLDAQRAAEYVDLPGFIWDHLKSGRMTRTHLSDVLRTSLLSAYGGAWVDATCLCFPGVDEMIDGYEKHDFFAFLAGVNNPGRISNWFLTSQANGYIVNMMREVLHAYWNTFNSIDDYFLYHHLFRALYVLDPKFAEIWNAVPHVHNKPAYTLIKQNDVPFDRKAYAAIVKASPLHKLTYKYRAIVPGSFLDKIVAEGTTI